MVGKEGGIGIGEGKDVETGQMKNLQEEICREWSTGVLRRQGKGNHVEKERQ